MKVTVCGLVIRGVISTVVDPDPAGSGLICKLGSGSILNSDPDSDAEPS